LRETHRRVQHGAAALDLDENEQAWALDYVHDSVASERAIRVLTVIDAFTRQCLALEVDPSFASRRVTRVWDQIVAESWKPTAIRRHNEPRLTRRHFPAWSLEWQIEMVNS
jgi:putative transposase